MRRRKILLVVLDGVGDRAVEALDGKTPLQASRHPHLDQFAAEGACGIMDTISPGIRPGSDTAHLALLGYDPYRYYTGRGPFEAAGVGILGKKGDVAFRCNFATVDDDLSVVDRRAGRIKEPDTTELVSSLQGMVIDDIEITVKEATEHRAVLMLSGEHLSSKVTDVDPHDLGPIHRCQPLEEGAGLTAKVVNEFVERSHMTMDDHPVNKRRRSERKPAANILLPRGPGTFPDIEPFESRYDMSAACISGVSLIKGIGRMLKMDVLEDPCFTGGFDTDIELKSRMAIRMLEENDFVLMNVKMTDIASHDSDHRSKMEVIERIDPVIGMLHDMLDPETVVAFTADHCTPISIGDHTGDPVPFVIWSSDGVPDEVSRYDEASCAVGGMGRIRGLDLMPILLDKANRSKKFGA
jgi:2,3-bisphosphoglycerate-independent phosphoglycerate mutase